MAKKGRILYRWNAMVANGHMVKSIWHKDDDFVLSEVAMIKWRGSKVEVHVYVQSVQEPKGRANVCNILKRWSYD